MNRERRKRIATVRKKVDGIVADIQAVIEALQEIRDDEEIARDSLPMSLQEGERAQQMQESIDALRELSRRWNRSMRTISARRWNGPQHE
ncbi:hypothetical protein ACFSHP_19460 [Novosphingobium panipatense]